MTDQKVTDLTVASLPLAGDEVLYLVQGAADRKVAARELRPVGIGSLAGSYTTHQAGQGRGASNLSTAAQSINRIEAQPFIPTTDFEIDRVGLVVTTAGSDLKIALYESTPEGLPGELIWETGVLSGASTGYVDEARSYAFRRGRLYWLATRAAGAVTLRGAVVASLISIGLAAGAETATAQATCFRRVVTFADPAPDPFVPVAAELVSTAMPYIYFRVA